MRFEPLNGHVVVRKLHGEAESPGGILLPETARKESVAAVVLQTSESWVDEAGHPRTTRLKRGDAVLVSKYAGENFRLGRDEVTILKETSIFCVLHDFIPPGSGRIPTIAAVPQQGDGSSLWGDGIDETAVPIAANGAA